MPNTQVPPEIGTLQHYYWEVKSHEWFQMLTPVQQRGLFSLSISNPVWGVCGCSRSGSLYTYTFMADEIQANAREVRCIICVQSRVINGLNISYDYWQEQPMTSSEITRLIIPDAYFPAPVEPREDCINCSRRIYEPTDINVTPASASSVWASTSNGNRVRVHANCSFECVCNNTYLTRGSNVYYVDRTLTCGSCVEELLDAEEIHQCENCSNYTSDIHWSEERERELCQSCFDEPWECNECGYEIEEGYDHECYRESDSLIYSYGYKPKPEFFGNDDYYFGLELEVEDVNGWGCENGAELVQNELGRRVYCKHDGSLTEGFEIVTHPHSFNELKSLDLRILDSLRRKGFRSWDTSTCGLHIHVSRTAFRRNGKRDEAHELRFQKLIYDNSVHVRAIAGRISDYARFDDKGKLVPKVKYGQSRDRREAVNSENDHTLEVRVFRGSLKSQRVLSAVEFVHSVVEYTRNMKVNPKDNQLSWIRFMSYVLDNKDKYQNFTQIALKTLDNPRNTQHDEEEN